MAVAMLAALTGCVAAGLNLPVDGPPAVPQGSLLRPSLGWLTTRSVEGAERAPEGSYALEQIRLANGRSAFQQVRRFSQSDGVYADSVVLDKETLKPITTVRTTPEGTWTTHYYRRQVDRSFTTTTGRRTWRLSELQESEPYSALGIELVISAMPLVEGFNTMIPVAVDTVQQGWSWLRMEVRREMSLVERPNLPAKSALVVDYTLAGEKTRLWIALDGRSVRKIERLGADDAVTHTVRRVLLGR